MPTVLKKISIEHSLDIVWTPQSWREQSLPDFLLLCLSSFQCTLTRINLLEMYQMKFIEIKQSSLSMLLLLLVSSWFDKTGIYSVSYII